MLKVLILNPPGPNTIFSTSHMANEETRTSSGEEKISSGKGKKESHAMPSFDLVKEEGSLKLLLLFLK